MTVISVCQAVKASGDVCGVKAPSYEINGEEMGLCGTHLNQVRRNQAIDILNENTTNKEESVRIYHFLKEFAQPSVIKRGKTTFPLGRIVTTNPSTVAPPKKGAKSEMARYLESEKDQKPVNNILALSTGEYRFHMLQKRLADRGYNFRLVIFKNSELRECDPAFAIGFGNKATYAYANDSHSFFLTIEGEEKWGLEAMGINTKDVKKLIKRQAELFRLSEMARYREVYDLTIREYDPEGLVPVEFIDGQIAFGTKFTLEHLESVEDPRRRIALRKAILNDEKVRFSVRIATPFGELKAHGYHNPKLDVDVVYHSSALKDEFATDGWVLSTLEYYNPVHVAVYDTQSIIDNKPALMFEKQSRDIQWMMTDIRQSFADGVVPEWLLLGESAHTEDGVPNYERLSEMLGNGDVRWQAAGLHIALLQNRIYTATNGAAKRLEREVRNEGKWNQFYRKTWTLMSNAFLAGVCTYEGLTKMCGFFVPRNGDYIQFDPRFGLIMSGRRFKETYNLHGGWDLDDAVKVILMKIWCEDGPRIQDLLDSGALDSKVVVPNKVENAVTVALLVRSPNGPGEYSIEALPANWQDTDIWPWHNLDENNIPIVNLSTLADPQPMLMEGVVTREIPTSLVHTKVPMTREQGLATINAQRLNPGIGGICAALMHYSNAFGPSFPAEILERLEEMIDTTQVSSDPESLAAIKDEIENFYDQMLVKLANGEGKIDKFLAQAYPFPEKYAAAMRQYEVVGRFTRFNSLYTELVASLKKEIKQNSFDMRQNQPLVATILELNVSSDTMKWAQSFYDRYNNELMSNDRDCATSRMEKNPFAKMHFEKLRTVTNKNTVGKAVKELEAFGGDTTHKRVLALWKYILLNHKLDRIIAQPGPDNHAVMDVLIKALVWRGLAVEFVPAAG